MRLTAFWDIAPYSLRVYWHFRGVYCLRHQGGLSPWWRQYVPLKRLSAPTRQHGAISQKAVMFILTAVRTWKLTSIMRLAEWIAGNKTRNGKQSHWAHYSTAVLWIWVPDKNPAFGEKIVIPIQTSLIMETCCTAGEADHSCQVKNVWRFPFTLVYMFTVWCIHSVRARRVSCRKWAT
jgi:hypothetical protein